tara:strand:- start:37 stop:246 length:210 start_codon:yes stop_codon:yes gene_type:complete
MKNNNLNLQLSNINIFQTELQKSMNLAFLDSQYKFDQIKPTEKQNCEDYRKNVEIFIYEILNRISIFSD